ncbi:MAG: helix-turn-helix transcriptional regulator [Clostridia bacterium]|nr:helix-turn-helix transcriptional regulator [Clostridia bacterium]
MQTPASIYKPQKSIDISTIFSIAYIDDDYTFLERESSPDIWAMIYIEKGEYALVTNKEPLVLRQGELFLHRSTNEELIALKQKSQENACALIISFRCASSAMHFFNNKKIPINITARLHLSTILYEIPYTRYLPFNSPDLVGFKPHLDKPLWAGDQTVIMRLELMLIDIIRSDSTFKKIPSTIIKKDDALSDDLCLKVIEYMELHINEKLSMETLSRSLSFSKSYISRRFAATYGCSIIDYFNQMKLNEAKRLIRDTNKNFFEISDMLMFSNSHYFSTLFKKHTGLTPTQYKKVCATSEEESIDEESSKEKPKRTRAKTSAKSEKERAKKSVNDKENK